MHAIATGKICLDALTDLICGLLSQAESRPNANNAAQTLDK